MSHGVPTACILLILGMKLTENSYYKAFFCPHKLLNWTCFSSDNPGDNSCRKCVEQQVKFLRLMGEYIM